MLHTIRTPQQLGTILRRIRRSTNMTQHELAQKAGLWQETVSNVERGATDTKLETIFSLLMALDLELGVEPRKKSKSSEIEEIF